MQSEGLSILDGPFTETKELISYVVYEVRSKQDVVEWIRRFMDLHRELWPGLDRHLADRPGDDWRR